MKEYTYPFQKGIKTGLRPRDMNPLNLEAFVQMDGAYVHNGVIREVELPTQIDTSSLSCSHPFPQIFKLNGITLVCTATTIYEYSLSAGTLTELLSVSEGTTWTVADFNLFIFMTNGRALVIRDGISGEWREYAECEIPYCICTCNLNGQIIIGGPETQVSAGFRG